VNALYGQAKYGEAINKYEELIVRGFESGNLYYNLGNCYFKANQLGKAILNYERARRLMPRDSDLRSNYEYARSSVKRDIIHRLPFYERIVYNITENLTIDGVTVSLSVVYIFIILTIIAAIYLKPFKKYANFIVLVLIITFILCSIAFRNKINLLNREAIITVENVEVKFEPSEKATTHFTLYEGMKVYVFPSNGDWCKVERPDGKIGWIKKSSFDLI